LVRRGAFSWLIAPEQTGGIGMVKGTPTNSAALAGGLEGIGGFLIATGGPLGPKKRKNGLGGRVGGPMFAFAAGENKARDWGAVRPWGSHYRKFVSYPDRRG